MTLATLITLATMISTIAQDTTVNARVATFTHDLVPLAVVSPK
jgi:hypothetical protein